MSRIKKITFILSGLCCMQIGFADQLIYTVPNGAKGGRFSFGANGNGYVSETNKGLTTLTYFEKNTPKYSHPTPGVSIADINYSNDSVRFLDENSNTLIRCHNNLQDCMKLDILTYPAQSLVFNDNGYGFVTTFNADIATSLTLDSYIVNYDPKIVKKRNSFRTWTFRDRGGDIKITQNALYLKNTDYGSASKYIYKKCNLNGIECISINASEFPNEDRELNHNNSTYKTTNYDRGGRCNRSLFNQIESKTFNDYEDCVVGWSLNNQGTGYVMTSAPSGTGGHAYYYENGVKKAFHTFEDLLSSYSFTGNALYIGSSLYSKTSSGSAQIYKCDIALQHCESIDKVASSPNGMSFDESGNGFVVTNDGHLLSYTNQEQIQGQGSIPGDPVYKKSYEYDDYIADKMVLNQDGLYIQMQRGLIVQCDINGKNCEDRLDLDNLPTTPNDNYYWSSDKKNLYFKENTATTKVVAPIAATAIFPWGKGSMNKLKPLSN